MADAEECTCFRHPPCGFCESLDEKEVDAFVEGGAAAVHRIREEREEVDRAG